jgi:hypothetical protein
MSDVARASLPVAILLLVLAATARAALWARLDDPRAFRLARQYLEPLSTWCLVAVATNLFAVSAAGKAGVLSLGLPLALGAAALMLRPSSEEERPAAVQPEPQRPARAAAPAAPVPAAPAPTPVTSLWVEQADDAPAREGRLWSR